jgi:hypothetical protein
LSRWRRRMRSCLCGLVYFSNKFDKRASE